MVSVGAFVLFCPCDGEDDGAVMRVTRSKDDDFPQLRPAFSILPAGSVRTTTPERLPSPTLTWARLDLAQIDDLFFCLQSGLVDHVMR